jgi:hypothetical protein
VPKPKQKPIKTRGRDEMALEVWTSRALSFDKNIKRHMNSIRVLLLGPGFPKGQLEIRQELAAQLTKDSCNIFIMETLSPISSYNLDEKFRDILDEINPDLIIPIFTENGAPHGVIFEIGFICGHLGIKMALNRLRFCFHHRLEKIKNVPAYLYYIVSRARYYEYHDEGDGPTLYDRVIQFIRDEVVRQFCPVDSCTKVNENEKK